MFSLCLLLTSFCSLSLLKFISGCVLMTSIGYFGPHTVLALVFRRECHYKFRIDPVMDLLWAARIKRHSMLINKKLKFDHKKCFSSQNWNQQKIQWNVQQERRIRFPALENYSYAGNYAEITGWLFSSIIRMPSNYTLFGDLHPIQSSKYFSFSQHFTFRMFILITLIVNKALLLLFLLDDSQVWM